MKKYLRLTISGLHRVDDGILIGGNATVIVNRGGEVICRETLSGKVSDKYSKLYEIEDTGRRTPAARHPLQKSYGQHRHLQPNGAFHIPHYVSPGRDGEGVNRGTHPGRISGSA